MKTYLALDFDGVICDSTDECIVAAWNGWLAFTGSDAKVRLPSEVPVEVVRSIRALRCYVKTLGEYLPVIRAGLSGSPVMTQSEYDDSLVGLATEMPLYARHVLEARDGLRERELKHWIGLHAIYEGFVGGFRRLQEEFEVFIVTGKDRSAVLALLAAAGIDFDGASVFDKDAAKNKLGMIRKISERRRIRLSSVFMLDDNVVHLMGPQDAGCRVFMAGWGYHTAEHVDVARSRNIPILRLDDWVDTLCNARNS